MKKVLQGAGYEVLLAADGQEAMDRLQAEHIDLLLLDMNLPLRTGSDILDHLPDPHLPIITLTAYPDQYRSATTARVSAFMEKPVDASRLLEVIQELLGDPQVQPGSRLAGCAEKPGQRPSSAGTPSQNRFS